MMAAVATAYSSLAQVGDPDSTLATSPRVVADSLTLIQLIESPGKISIEAPEGLVDRLQNIEASSEATEAEEERASQSKARVGYRILVFEDNNPRTAKHDAQNRKRQMESRFPEYRAYVQFKTPYWYVRVGDFKTRSEAQAALGAFKAAFPRLSGQFRLVRDRINVNH